MKNTLTNILGRWPQRVRLGSKLNPFLQSLPMANHPYNPMINYHLLRSPIKVGNLYYIYEEWSDVFAESWYIGYRNSLDGVNWGSRTGPLLTKGTTGEFDDWGQADPSVIYDGVGDWKMWFDATQGSFENWVSHGYATSVDGINWTKYGAVIDRGATGEWDDFAIHHPSVIKHNGLYYMFYSGASQAVAPQFVEHIGLATSPDGINWTKHPNNPLILKGSAGEWDSLYVRPSNPIYIDGLWLMYYWGRQDGGSTYDTGLATSKDLVNWTKRGKVLDNAIGTGVILRQGTNPKDKIIKMWSYHNVDGATKKSNYHTIAGKNNRNKLHSFTHELVGGDSTNYAGNYIYYHKLSLAQTTAKGIRVFVLKNAVPTYGNIKCAIYSDNASVPQTLLAVSEEKAWIGVDGDVWTYFDLPSDLELAAGSYWVGIWSTEIYWRSRPIMGTDNWMNQNIAYGEFPATATPTTLRSFGADVIIADYTNTCWTKALASEPNNVYFNGVKGVKVANPADVVAEYNWTWRSGILYVYSEFLTDLDYEISYD